MKSLTLLFLMVVLPAAVPSQTPTSTSKPTTPFGVGKLTYTDGGDIWVMDGDGSNRVHVIDAGTNDTAPVWSPDGSKIAFTSDRSPSSNGGVWVVNADGTGLTLVTYIPGDRSADPTWSPDGTKIAFTSRRDTLIASIYLVNADGSNLTRLTNQLPYSDASPDWSPDGSKIVFETNQGLGSNMAVINADGSGRVLLGAGQYPEWSPDSSKILYSKPVQDAGLQLFVMNADGTGVTQLTSGVFDDHYPAWRYDGRKIAFVRNLSGTTRIWTMDADGAGQVNITGSIQNAGQSFPDWQFLTPTAASASISGSVINPNGTPVSGVVINLSGSQSRKTITDSDGNYRFDNVETNGFYTVTPKLVNNTFNPPLRAFSQLGETTSALFTALPSADQLNPLDMPEYFVRQHYLDFLGREPDESGFNFWSDQLLECGVDLTCLERRQVNVSAAYFLSIEFQQTGGLVDKLYRASYGRRPRYAEFMPDSAELARGVIVGRVGWQQQLEANKAAFINAWVQRPAFRAAYDGLSNDGYVDQLIQQTGVNFAPSDREALVVGLSNGSLTRTGALRRIIENQSFTRAKFNEAFVMMEYFGYLRRDPDESGYQFWLQKLNEFNGNFEKAQMVEAFIISGEYRQRFVNQ